MFEFGFASLCATFTAGLVIAFRRQRSLKRRVDRLVLDHNILADRVLLLTLNRGPAQAIEPSDGRPEAETARIEIHHLPSPRLVT
jgi:hypothetical protein